MNDYQRLIRDIKRDPKLEVRRGSHALRVRLASGRGPQVSLSSTCKGEGRGLRNAIAQLRRAGLVPAGWE